jgi:hypothetical protein
LKPLVSPQNLVSGFLVSPHTWWFVVGGWITYQLAAGTYYFNDPLSISSPFVTIEGPTTSSGNGAIFVCDDQCLIVNSPSLRIINVNFRQSTAPITINSDIYDVAIITSSFVGITGTALKVLSGSVVAVVDSSFDSLVGSDGVAISLTSANLTVVGSTFNRNVAIAGSGAAIFGTSSNVVVSNVTFSNLVATTGAAISLQRGSLSIINSVFTNCSATFGGSISLQLMQSSSITSSRFSSSTSGTGSIRLVSASLTVTSSSFDSLYAAIQGNHPHFDK